MRDLSLHLLDIAQNSIRAGAAHVDIGFSLSENGLLTLTIKDDGCGMSPELVQSVTSPFTTTRTTRRIGLGIPMLRQNALLSGGDMTIRSEEGVGTEIAATFDTHSIDCLPVGDLAGTLVSLIMANPEKPEFTLRCVSPKGEMTFSTEEVRAALPDVSLAEPEVVQWMQSAIEEEVEPILGGIAQ